MLFLRQLFAYLNTFEIRMSFLGNVDSVIPRENNAGTIGRDATRRLRSFVSADLHNLKTFTFHPQLLHLSGLKDALVGAHLQSDADDYKRQSRVAFGFWAGRVFREEGARP